MESTITCKTEARPEGWEMGPFSIRFHYFRNGISLCGRYHTEATVLRYEDPRVDLCCRECAKRKLREP